MTVDGSNLGVNKKVAPVILSLGKRAEGGEKRLDEGQVFGIIQREAAVGPRQLTDIGDKPSDTEKIGVILKKIGAHMLPFSLFFGLTLHPFQNLPAVDLDIKPEGIGPVAGPYRIGSCTGKDFDGPVDKVPVENGAIGGDADNHIGLRLRGSLDIAAQDIRLTAPRQVHITFLSDKSGEVVIGLIRSRRHAERGADGPARPGEKPFQQGTALDFLKHLAWQAS